jgi:ATP-dependent DNA helicase RecQ
MRDGMAGTHNHASLPPAAPPNPCAIVVHGVSEKNINHNHMNPLTILEKQFGYAAFRLNQEAIIQSVLAKKDTFVLMPTGGGKSLCYQIPALMLEGLTIVVSPLIALMKDQVDALRLNGIQAAYLNSTQTYQEQEAILRDVRLKKLKLLYLAPEKLLGNSMAFLHTLGAFGVRLIAIDEAHCISHWGHDFRPEYLMLATLKRSFPDVPVIALTATADRLTQKDIVEKLELKNPAVFISSFNRANIRYTVERKKGDAFGRLLTFLDKRKDQSGIIYCLSRKSTEMLAEDLELHGFKALPYHAGMERAQRTRNQEMFLRDEVRIMVATIAFGMGIDKSNVRYVVHMDLPKNVESYYQETGRAGRDGLPSDALLFYGHGDVVKLKRFALIENNPEQTEIQLKKLDQMGRYGELFTCRRKYLLNYFDEKADDPCGNCDVCLSAAEMFNATVPARKVIAAVSRLGERFGAGYVVDFLRGSKSAKMHRWHQTQENFGAGADLSKEAWNRIISELIQRGYLIKSYDDGYPLLKLAGNSAAVLTGTEKVMLTKDKERSPEWAEIQGAELPYETDLYEVMKDLRRKFAGAQNVAPYIILSDATLIEMATYLPQRPDELSRISGFGDLKLERYGPDFLKAITAWCNDHNMPSRINMKSEKKLRNSRPARETNTMQQSLTLFRQGSSIEQIAALRKLSPGTIEGHLAVYVEKGKIDVEELVDPARLAMIRNAIEQVGGKMLSPIKNFLGEKYSYGEIKYAMAEKLREESRNQNRESIKQ